MPFCAPRITFSPRLCQIHHLNPAMLRAGGFGVITVCRPLEKASLLKELSPSFRNIAILVEDSTILSAEMEKTSSNMVRVTGKSLQKAIRTQVFRSMSLVSLQISSTIPPSDSPVHEPGLPPLPNVKTKKTRLSRRCDISSNKENR